MLATRKTAKRDVKAKLKERRGHEQQVRVASCLAGLFCSCRQVTLRSLEQNSCGVIETLSLHGAVIGDQLSPHVLYLLASPSSPSDLS